MKRILLVEDNETFRAALKSILNKRYDVMEAGDGRQAREMISSFPIDLVISDIQMPHFDGVELLEWIKANHPTPVILMTGFSHILETKKAHELGADDFLAKPFKEEELKEKISRILKEEQPQAPVAAPGDLDKEFCKIPIEDFISEKQADYAVFIRMPNAKYIKIAHQGGKLPPEKVASFKEKGVNHLYIRQEDFGRLVGFTTMISKAVATSSQVNKEKKVRFMHYTGELIAQQAFVRGTDEALFRNAKDFLTTSLDLMTEEEENFALLGLLSGHTDFLYAHALGVSVFSVMIARQMGWKSPQTLFKILSPVFSMISV